MSYTQVPSLVTFAPLTTILSADVNSNNAALRNVINGVVVGANAIAADSITEVTVGTGITVNKRFAVSAGVATFASGIAITAGVVSGLATFSSGWAVSGGTINVSGVTVSGIATFSSGITFSSGTIVQTTGASLAGIATFVSGINFAAGAAFVIGTSDNQAITVKANNVNKWTIAATGAFVPVTDQAVDIGQSAILLATLYAAAVDVRNVNVSLQTIWSLSGAPNIVSGNAHVRFNTAAGFNVATATVATSATTGYIFVPAVPGTSTGVPNLSISGGGGVALAYDTTNNRLQVYNGAWKTVLLA